MHNVLKYTLHLLLHCLAVSSLTKEIYHLQKIGHFFLSFSPSSSSSLWEKEVVKVRIVTTQSHRELKPKHFFLLWGESLEKFLNENGVTVNDCSGVEKQRKVKEIEWDVGIQTLLFAWSVNWLPTYLFVRQSNKKLVCTCSFCHKKSAENLFVKCWWYWLQISFS